MLRFFHFFSFFLIIFLLLNEYTDSIPRGKDKKKCNLLNHKPDSSYDDLCLMAQYLINKGSNEEGMSCLQEATSMEPEKISAWHLIARLALEIQDYDQALNSLAQMVKIAPDNEEYLDYYAQTSAALRVYDKAVDAYTRLSKVRPEDFQVHSYLGYCHHYNGNPEMGLASFIKAVSLIPKGKKIDLETELVYVNVYDDLTNLLISSNRVNEAIQYCEKAIEQFSNHKSSFLVKLGRIYNSLSKSRKAIEVLTRAIETLKKEKEKERKEVSILDLDFDDIIVETQDEDWVEMMERKEDKKSRKDYSTYVESQFELGKAYSGLNQLEDAEKYFKETLKYYKNNSAVWYALGVVQRSAQNHEEALFAFEKAYDLDNGNEMYFSDYLHIVKHVCEWEKFESLMEKRLLPKLKKGDLGNLHPFSAIMYNLTNDIIFKASKMYADSQALSSNRKTSATVKGSFQSYVHNNKETYLQSARSGSSTGKKKKNPRKIKLGYVSSNFINHAQGSQLSSYFKHHDRERFEVYAFSVRQAVAPEAKSQEKIIKEQVDHFIYLTEMNDYEAANLIYEHQIDILIDLCGPIDEARLGVFSLNPSPIQISFLGYPGTTGATFMHYYVGDPISTPIDLLSPYFTEKFILMPHTYQVTEHRETYYDPSEVQPLTKKELFLTSHTEGVNKLPFDLEEDDIFIFCNFNQAIKIDRKTFSVWMRILKKVPQSILWLLALPSAAEPRLKKAARSYGIQPERIIFAKSIPKEHHIQRMRHSHLLLDTPIYNAHTSAGDALWAGLPILTMLGNTMPSRVCGSMVTAAGFPDMIVKSFEEYEEKAVDFAFDRKKLEKLRKRVEGSRKKMNLFDTEQYVADLEKGLIEAWRRYLQGKEPDHIDVSLLV